MTDRVIVSVFSAVAIGGGALMATISALGLETGAWVLPACGWICAAAGAGIVIQGLWMLVWMARGMR